MGGTDNEALTQENAALRARVMELEVENGLLRGDKEALEHRERTLEAQLAESELQVYEFGKELGRWQEDVADLPEDAVNEIVNLGAERDAARARAEDAENRATRAEVQLTDANHTIGIYTATGPLTALKAERDAALIRAEALGKELAAVSVCDDAKCPTCRAGEPCH